MTTKKYMCRHPNCAIGSWSAPNIHLIEHEAKIHTLCICGRTFVNFKSHLLKADGGHRAVTREAIEIPPRPDLVLIGGDA